MVKVALLDGGSCRGAPHGRPRRAALSASSAAGGVGTLRRVTRHTPEANLTTTGDLEATAQARRIEEPLGRAGIEEAMRDDEFQS